LIIDYCQINIASSSKNCYYSLSLFLGIGLEIRFLKKSDFFTKNMVKNDWQKHARFNRPVF